MRRDTPVLRSSSNWRCESNSASCSSNRVWWTPKNLVNFPIEPVEFGIQLWIQDRGQRLHPSGHGVRIHIQKAVAWNLNASQRQQQTTWAQTWEQDLSSMNWSLEPKWIVSPLFFSPPFYIFSLLSSLISFALLSLPCLSTFSLPSGSLVRHNSHHIFLIRCLPSCDDDSQVWRFLRVLSRACVTVMSACYGWPLSVQSMWVPQRVTVRVSHWWSLPIQVQLSKQLGNWMDIMWYMQERTKTRLTLCSVHLMSLYPSVVTHVLQNHSWCWFRSLTQSKGFILFSRSRSYFVRRTNQCSNCNSLHGPWQVWLRPRTLDSECSSSDNNNYHKRRCNFSVLTMERSAESGQVDVGAQHNMWTRCRVVWRAVLHATFQTSGILSCTFHK